MSEKNPLIYQTLTKTLGTEDEIESIPTSSHSGAHSNLPTATFQREATNSMSLNPLKESKQCTGLENLASVLKSAAKTDHQIPGHRLRERPLGMF